MIETLNTWGAAWAARVVEGALASTGVFVALTLLWLAARRWASAHVGYALSLLALAPLALPVARWAPASAGPELRDRALAPLRAALAEPVELERRVAPAPSARAEPELERASDRASKTPPARATLTARGAAFALWLAVVLLLLARAVSTQLATHRRVRSARALDPAVLLGSLAELHREVGLARRPRLVELDGVGSPAVWGLARPTLILPPGFVARHDEGTMRWILLHELAHLRRGDLAVGAAQRLLTILWFFHPVAWLASRRVDELREIACDEAALARCPQGARRRSAHVLVSLAEERAAVPARRLALQPFLGSGSLLERRVMRLIDSRREALPGLGLAALPLLLLGVGATLVASAVAAAPAAPLVRAETDLDAAIARGVDWLLAQQQPDGGWLVGRDAKGEPIAWTGELDRFGVTGVALDALQRCEPAPRIDAAVARARRFLAEHQDPATGRFGDGRTIVFVPSHMLATIAWLSGRERQPEAEWRPVAERALAFVLAARNPYRGWRYDCPPVGDDDSFVTSLAMQALALAREAGLEVPRPASQAGLEVLRAWTDEQTGRTGYQEKGSPVSRLQVKAADYPVEYTEMLTAMAICARLDWGADPEDAQIARGARLVAAAAPFWDEELGSIDTYHWYFGTEALRRVGGPGWARWRPNVLAALLPNQRDDGSWPAIDAWGFEGTEPHMTAWALRCLLAAR